MARAIRDRNRLTTTAFEDRLGNILSPLTAPCRIKKSPGTRESFKHNAEQGEIDSATQRLFTSSHCDEVNRGGETKWISLCVALCSNNVPHYHSRCVCKVQKDSMPRQSRCSSTSSPPLYRSGSSTDASNDGTANRSTIMQSLQPENPPKSTHGQP
jgi:hypothetical protein